MMERIIFPENVEVGKFYLVPHVWIGPNKAYSGKNGRYVPINTHLHDDKKVINFTYTHWHIDWRFVDDSMWKAKIENAESVYRCSKGKREVANIIIFCDKGTLDIHTNSTEDATIYYRRVKCKREYRAHEFYKNDIYRSKPDQWVNQLPKAFCNSKLKEDSGNLICPHKGAHIDRNCKDEDGNYVCPAHLLRFDPITLKVVQNKLLVKRELKPGRGSNSASPKHRAI
jgi:hypothetical protein